MADLRAITLKPLWAYAVTHLGKRIENRSTRSPMLADGRRFAIHAGKFPHQLDVRGRMEIEDQLAWMKSKGLAGPDVDRSALIERSSAIVATARIEVFVDSSESPWFRGPIGWLLADVFVLPEPVACHGRQGIWRVPHLARAMVKKQDELLERVPA